MPQVLIDQGNGREALIKEQSKVEGEIFRFYKDLFSNKDDQIQSQSIETFLEVVAIISQNYQSRKK